MRVCEVLIVGGGMAGARLAQRLVSRKPDASVIIAGDEPDLGYNRVLLPDYVAGACTRHQMQTPESVDLTTLTETRIDAIDLQRRVAVAGHERLQFENLVFATGSTAPIPPIPGIHLPGVMPLRTLANADELRSEMHRASRAVVLGGGLLGLETADALSRQGLDVHVVHRGSALMHRQLDDQSAELLADHLRARGIGLSLEASIAAVEGDKHINAVTLDNGVSLETDLLLLATGTTPRVELAQTAGVPCNLGILVDDRLQTQIPGVCAIGECANMSGQRAGLVALVNQQADVLAENLSGGDARMPDFVPSTHLKLEHLALFSAGQTRPEGATEDVVIRDRTHGIYRRLFFQGSTLIGAVLFGRINGAAKIAAQINSFTDSSTREQLAFGY